MVKWYKTYLEVYGKSFDEISDDSINHTSSVHLNQRLRNLQGYRMQSLSETCCHNNGPFYFIHKSKFAVKYMGNKLVQITYSTIISIYSIRPKIISLRFLNTSPDTPQDVH